MENDKIKTMLNFALKSNHVVIGSDNIFRRGNYCEVIFVDVFLGNNTLSKIKKHCEQAHILLIATNFLEVLSLNNMAGCKVLGMTDHNMCELIRSEIGNYKNYRIIMEGGNLG